MAHLPLGHSVSLSHHAGGQRFELAHDVASNALLPALSELLGYAQGFHVRIDASAAGQH